MDTMKAVRIHSYGNRDVLVYEDAPLPVVNDDDILIRVHATAVNPLDWKIRAGYLSGWFNYTMPWILGLDVSGVVTKVGSAVTGFAVGDEVFARADLNRSGTYAEYVVVREADVARKPRTLSHIGAAAIPHAFLAAWTALVKEGRLSRGEVVLIHGAAGGVGTFAIQIAKSIGAHIIATASGANLDLLRQLGADEVIDYTQQRFEDHVQDVDVVLDTVGGDTLQRSFGLLKKNGRLVSLVEMPSPETAAAHHVTASMAQANTDGALLREASVMANSGTIRPVVSTILPLAEIQQAHALSESLHARGKIILQVV